MTFDAKAEEAMTATTFVPNTHLMSGLLGPRDEHLRVIERSFPASKIRVQGNQISVTGPDAAKVLRLFDELVLVLESGQALDVIKISRTVDMVADDLRPSEVLKHEVVRGAKGKAIRPSTAGQKRYIHQSSPLELDQQELERVTWPWPKQCKHYIDDK